MDKFVKLVESYNTLTEETIAEFDRLIEKFLEEEVLEEKSLVTSDAVKTKIGYLFSLANINPTKIAPKEKLGQYNVVLKYKGDGGQTTAMRTITSRHEKLNKLLPGMRYDGVRSNTIDRETYVVVSFKKI